MELIKKKVSELIPYINNSRIHSEEQIIQLISSIKEFGFTNPILIDQDNSIIAGHGRLLAVKKLGYDEVPCIIISGLSKTQIKALIIADNQLALNGSWDLDRLSLEIDGLKEDNFNLDILAFNTDFLKDIQETIIPLADLPEIKEGDKKPFQQMTFIIHDSQIKNINLALENVKKNFDLKNEYNQNINGNAISEICKNFYEQNSNS
jgi:ParB family transcriptional regulator, chromosome partitioning protein